MIYYAEFFLCNRFVCNQMSQQVNCIAVNGHFVWRLQFPLNLCQPTPDRNMAAQKISDDMLVKRQFYYTLLTDNVTIYFTERIFAKSSLI